MSDRFSCLPIDKLMEWILGEERMGRIFGIGKGLFFRPNRDDPFRMERYGQMLETPVGVAAGVRFLGFPFVPLVRWRRRGGARLLLV